MGTSFESLTELPRPLGPFTLIRLIAQGGMGQVFLALRPVDNEPTDEVCVVKTVRTDLKDDREAVGRFLDEARVVQKLDHPSICHTLDAGVVDRIYYLALEFISGRNIRDVQTRAQKLGQEVPDTLIFHILSEVLVALDYAHGLVDPMTGRPLGIVHRDVSPHNVMLGFDGYVKLIDFGLADHELKQELTRPGIMVGKLRYNAPEQVRDRAIDGRSDLYSVGVMLYELIVGERFYEGLSEEDIWRVAMKGTHRPRLYDRVPPDLRNILELALAGSPRDRFQSAAHMRDAILEAAASRRVREARRASARFMTEIFAAERQLEREMILQATGLAEARTRLFAQPAVSDEPSVSTSTSVGRTKVVSPAEVRGRLADLVSGFDPNAETQMPSQPVSDLIERIEADRVARDPNVFADSESDQTMPANVAAALTTRVRSLDGDTPADVAPPRRVVDENLRPAMNATAPSLPRRSREGAREPQQRALARPLPPLEDPVTSPSRRRTQRAPPPPRISPAAIAAAAAVVLVVLAVLAAIAVPQLLDERAHRKPVVLVEAAPTVDPPHDATLPAADAGTQDGAGQDGAHDDGAHDDGAHDDGAHDDGAHDDGAHDDGAHDDGAHDDGTGRRRP